MRKRKRFVAVGIALVGAITAIAVATAVVAVRGNMTARGARDPCPLGQHWTPLCLHWPSEVVPSCGGFRR